MPLLGRSWASVGGPGLVLGHMLAVLGALGALWAILGRSWDLSWRSWAAIGAYVGGLAPLCWRSWAALGAYVDEKYEEHGYFENMLISQAGARSAASGAVRGRSWGPSWQS